LTSIRLSASWPPASCSIVASGRVRRRQDHHATLPAPTLQAQFVVLALPLGTGIPQALLAHRPLDRAPNALGQPQLEEIRLAALLGLAHYRLIAPLGIATQQRRPMLRCQPIQQRPQPGDECFGLCSLPA
jgi:hypothetical protein